MKKFSALFWFVLVALALNATACKKKDVPTDATQPLQQSFQTADPAVQKAMTATTTSLKLGNYAEAARTLEPVVSGHRLTDPQKQAVGVALKQINQAIVADPKLDTKEMYDLRAKMFNALQNGPRF